SAVSVCSFLSLCYFVLFIRMALLDCLDHELAVFRILSSDVVSVVRSACLAVLFCILLLLFAGSPAFIGMTNSIYLLAEIILGGLFTAAAMRFHRAGDPANARLLFFSSIIYLPLLFAILMLTKL